MVARRICQVLSSPPFVCSSFGLVSKDDSRFQKIYHFSFPIRLLREQSYSKKNRVTRLHNTSYRVPKSYGKQALLRYYKTRHNERLLYYFFGAEYFMVLWILLEGVLIYQKLSNSWTFNIIFHPQPICESFRFDPTVFLRLRFRTIFGLFCGTPTCSQSHDRQKSDKKQ